MIRYRCPSCGILLGVSPRLAGSVAPCPVCQQKVIISAQSQPLLESLPAQSLVIPPLPEAPVLLEPPPTGAKLGHSPTLPSLPVTRSEARSANIVPRSVKQASVLLILGVPVSIANLILWGILSGGICCFSPLNLLSILWPVMGLVQGIRLWTGSTRNRPEMTIFAQILLICNLDLLNFLFGLGGFVLLCHPTARAYFTAKE